jgi:hypothetical protein
MNTWTDALHSCDELSHGELPWLTLEMAVIKKLSDKLSEIRAFTLLLGVVQPLGKQAGP